MNEELKPCPFCGKPFEILPSENMEDHWAYKHHSADCPMERNELTGWVWSSKDIMAQQFNARPIEDALRERITQLEEELGMDGLEIMQRAAYTANDVERFRRMWQKAEKELADLREASKATCLWEEDPDGYWETGCGTAFIFEEGNPEENENKYCPRCGKKVVLEALSGEAGDD